MLTTSIMTALEWVGILLCILSCLAIGFILGRWEREADREAPGGERAKQRDGKSKKRRETLPKLIVEAEPAWRSGGYDREEVIGFFAYLWFVENVEAVAKRSEKTGYQSVVGDIDILACELEEAVGVAMKFEE